MLILRCSHLVFDIQPKKATFESISQFVLGLSALPSLYNAKLCLHVIVVKVPPPFV